jgi:glyoxylate reductase
MDRPRVLVTRETPGRALAMLEAVAEVTVWPELSPPPRDELLRLAAGARALLPMLTERIDAELLDAAPSVRIVANMAVGYDNIDVPAATERGVAVTNTPGVLTETTADLAFALLLAGARRVAEGDRLVRAGGWPTWYPTFMLGHDVYGATLGIIGMGAIGQAVAHRARCFGMTVLYYSRGRKQDLEDAMGIAYCELPSLLAESDFVSLHCPLTAETRGLIGSKELASMKPSAVLVNTARGPVVDQRALVYALRHNTIAHAALDVTEVEPIAPDDPLLTLDNVTITPHVGSATVTTRARMAEMAAQNIVAFLRGERPPNLVNPGVTGTRAG